METPQISVGLVQQANTSDRKSNLATSAEAARQCKIEGAQLIVFPELHTGPYFCQTEAPAVFDQAESIPGPSTVYFGALAKELDCVLIISLFERRAPGLFHNTAVVLETDGSIAGTYRKMHIPDDPGYYEKFYFTPGDLGFKPISTSVGKLGVLLCWDQWFPEAARLMALAGAELLVYPSAIGYEPSDSPEEQARQREAWIISQRAHAVANGLPVISVNRTGYEADPSGTTNGIQFWGSSFVVGPQGEYLYQAPEDEAVHAVVSIDRSRTEIVRRIWPFFRDRRIDAYSELTKRYRDK